MTRLASELRRVRVRRELPREAALPADSERLDGHDLRPRYDRTRVITDVRRLSRVGNLRSAAAITLHWSVIAVATWAAIASGHWAVYVVAALVIATRLQALGVLLHDATHWLLFTNRTVNDVVSDLFLAFPLGLSTTLYRRTHFQHHRRTGTEDDPDLAIQRTDANWFVWPKSTWECVQVIVKSSLALDLHKGYRFFQQWSPSYNFFRPLSRDYPLSARVLFVFSTCAFYGPVIYFGLLPDLLLLYALPGITLLGLANRLRNSAEHLRTPGTHELNSTRTVVPSGWEKLAIAPHGVSYHLEHHLFPSVPCGRLAELHRVLMQDPEFRLHAHITHSYAGVLREFMQVDPAAPRAEGD